MNIPLSPQASRARTHVLVAFAIVYTVWGSTYMAIRVAVETLPPFLLSGVRFVFAGTVLLAWLRFRRVPLPSKTEWRHAAVSGALILAGGNAVVVWAEQTIPSSVAALTIAWMSEGETSMLIHPPSSDQKFLFENYPDSKLFPLQLALFFSAINCLAWCV